MEVELASLTGVKFAGTAAELRLPTMSGIIGVLPHHEDLITAIAPGELEVVLMDDKVERYVVFGGLADISATSVRLLVQDIEHVDELIEGEIEAALAEAKRLEASAENVHQELQASRSITRHSLRLRTVRRHHRSR